jgi:hypothetical protein
VLSADIFMLIIGHARNGTALGLSIRAQTASRHRSQIALSADECRALGLPVRPSVIDTESVWPSRSPVVRGHCSSDLLRRVAETMRRCQETTAIERQHVGVPSCL